MKRPIVKMIDSRDTLFDCEDCVSGHNCDFMQDSRDICPDFFPSRETIRRLFREEFKEEIAVLYVSTDPDFQVLLGAGE